VNGGQRAELRDGDFVEDLDLLRRQQLSLDRVDVAELRPRPASAFEPVEQLIEAHVEVVARDQGIRPQRAEGAQTLGKDLLETRRVQRRQVHDTLDIQRVVERETRPVGPWRQQIGSRGGELPAAAQPVYRGRHVRAPAHE